MVIGMTVTAGKIDRGISIFTLENDFHAYVIRHCLHSRGIHCSIIETNGLSVKGGMSWSCTSEVANASINDVEGNQVILADLGLVWWRRFNGKPQFPEMLTDKVARDLVVNECRATVLGIAVTEFQGIWVNPPEANRIAENKLIQLKAAQQADLRLPKTLISQDPNLVKKFCADLNYRVVVKTVAGTHDAGVLVGRVTPEILTEEAISICPAIYQEFIPGKNHLRICCFGNQIHTVLLKSERLDWRYPLDVIAEPFKLDQLTELQIFKVLSSLNLPMGIIDMKLSPEGEPIWFEVNPQGQFLFLEGLCGIPLAEFFTDFLISEINSL